MAVQATDVPRADAQHGPLTAVADRHGDRQFVPDRDAVVSALERVTARAVTATIVVGPLVGVGFGVVEVWRHGVSALDLVLALMLYLVVGHGVTVGFHRLLTHRSFRAARPLELALAVLGSMAFEGGVISWVASHRRHHAFGDRPGDPHSPTADGRSAWRGLWHAHVGWLFRTDATSARHFAPELVADPAIVMIDRLFPLWCVLSLALPFGLGWLVGGTLTAALSALVWAGAIRVAVLHQTTWAINSVCHAVGQRPFRTPDRSRNVALLATVSMGESWHNAHHAFPALARHGVDPGQRDSSAAIIRLFERLGWAHHVRWPEPDRLAARRQVVVASS